MTHGALILFGGLGVFAFAALFALHAYNKGQLDKNHNGISDLLEKTRVSGTYGQEQLNGRAGIRMVTNRNHR